MTQDGGPTPAMHTTIVHHDQEIACIEFADPTGGRWFRLHCWLIDSGVFAQLSDSAVRVMIVYARHADRDRVSMPSMGRLRKATGLRDSAIYRGRQELVKHPARLLREIRKGVYELCPDRPFITRLGSTTVEEPPPRWRSDLHHGGETSTTVEKPPPRWSPDSKQNSEQDIDDRGRRCAVAELVRLEKFDPQDAERLIQRTGAKVSDVQMAHKNAETIVVFKVSRAAFIASQLRQCPVLPFAAVTKRSRALEAKEERKELIAAIREVVDIRGQRPEVVSLFNLTETRSPKRLAELRLFTVAELRDAADPFGLIVGRIHDWTHRHTHPRLRTSPPLKTPVEPDYEP